VTPETIAVRVGSWTYRWPPGAAAGFGDVRSLLADEEQRALRLLPMLDHAPEHLLVHQVRMYLFRFAVPAVEIETSDLGRIDVDRVQKRLWTCLFGRALDDLVDGDSRFFTPAASCVLLLHYARLLGREGADVPDASVFTATRPSPDDLSTDLPCFDRIRADVCARVDYFLAPADDVGADARRALGDYAGVLLGSADLADAVADMGRASTVLSRHLRRHLEDDEGKILLGPSLVRWYERARTTLIDAATGVSESLRATGATYAAAIVDDQRAALLGAEAHTSLRGWDVR